MPSSRFTFTAEDRLKGRTAFAEVHGGRTRRESGPRRARPQLKDCWQTACFCATCAACVGTGQPCWDCIADSDCCPKKEPEPES